MLQKGFTGLRIILNIFLVPFTLLILVNLISQIVSDKPPSDFLITKNFVDITQVDGLSKLRSCEGHRNMPQYTDEPNSSFKHYLYFKDKRIPGNNQQVKIFAPFDGYIVHPLSQGVTMVPLSTRFPWWPLNQWRFNVEPVHTLPQFGGIINKVKAGELIGYFNDDRFGNAEKEAPITLDLIAGVTAIPPQFKDGNGEPWKKMDSVFNYMSDAVFEEYKSAIPGLVNRDDLIISREWRETHPCKYRAEGGPYFDNGRPGDRIIEEQNVYLGIGIKDLDKIKKKLMGCYSEDVLQKPVECSK
ncbi:hypothetical protein HYW46_00105 [Candidatus Daviesbacteria bacterium]|nr:hypothetical protein [Candidatus Daviesbacteria bacterium]